MLPSVSILFPTKNDQQFIGTTLLSLIRETQLYAAKGGAVHLCIVNDGSTDGTAQVIQTLLKTTRLHCKFIDRKENRGVTYSLAEAFSAVGEKGNFVLRCDADARFLVSGWLEAMVDFMSSDDRVGIVAPMMIFPDGTVDCHGVAYFPSGRQFIAHDEFAASVGLDTIREVDTVLGAYSMMRQSDWNIDLGYFLWYEDEDQGLTIRTRGRKCFSMGTQQVVHYNRIRNVRVSDAGFAPSRSTSLELRLEKLNTGMRMVAGAMLPKIKKGGQSSKTAVAAKTRSDEIRAESIAHFEKKWGFSALSPDMNFVRSKFKNSELLWSESETLREAGVQIVARYLGRQDRVSGTC